MASQATQKDANTSQVRDFSGAQSGPTVISQSTILKYYLQKVEHQHDTACHQACDKLEAKLREEEWESRVHPGRFGTQSPEPQQEKKDPRANVARKESVSDAAKRLEAKLYEEEWNNRPHGW